MFNYILAVMMLASPENTQPIVKMHPMKENALIDYANVRTSLSTQEIDALLDQGRELALKNGLVETLANGGSAFFPHCDITKGGDQIAAVAYASLMSCEKTGKTQILVLGVLHSVLKEQLWEARKKELSGTDLSDEPCRGIFGPGLPNETIFSKEYSLDHFVFLIKHAAEKYQIPLPKLILRYPNLVNGHSETMSGIDDLKILSENSIVVATGDLCHHGIAYGHETPFAISDKGTAYAKNVIEESLSFLTKQDYLGYRNKCVSIVSDSKDVGQMLVYLLGPLKGTIYDLRLVDVSDIFSSDVNPSWVAASLVGLVPANKEAN
jgi:hypothetical protein